MDKKKEYKSALKIKEGIPATGSYQNARTVTEYLHNSFYNQEEVKQVRPELENQLYEGSVTSFRAAVNLLDKYFKR